MFSKINYILLFCTAIAFSQHKGYDFEKAEKETRKLIFSTPEKAPALIKQILAQPNLHDTILGKTYNLYGMYFGVTGHPDSLIKYMEKSISYLEKYPKIKVRSLMNLSFGYRNKAETPQAIAILNQALELYRRQNDKVGIATAYGEIATNYSYMQDYKSAVDYLLKAIPMLKAEKETQKLLVVQQKLANTYMAMGNFDFAADLNRECAAGFKKSGETNNYYLTLINLGECLTKTKKYNEAQKILDEALKGLKSYGDKELIGIAEAHLGALWDAMGNRAKAVNHYKTAIENLFASKSGWTAAIAGEYIAKLNALKDYDTALKVITGVETLGLFDKSNPEGKRQFIAAAAEAYNHLGKTKEAIEAYTKTLALMDTINNIKKTGAIQEIQAKYQTEIQQEKKLRLEATNRVLEAEVVAAKVRLWFYIVLGIVVIVLILLVLRGYLLKNRLQNERLKGVKAEHSLIQQQQFHEEELIKAQKEIINEKQRELTGTAQRMADLQDSIDKLIEKIDNNEIIKIAEAKGQLLALVKQQDYWQQFESRFNSLHPEFAHTLGGRFEKLTKNDIDFCSLLKLNLSNKEIASLLQISHESVITKKYRIKKKMGITEDEEFENLLMEM